MQQRSFRAPRWQFALAIIAAAVLGGELVVFTTLGRRLPNGLPAVAGWSFVVVGAIFLFVIGRWEVTTRGRTTRHVDQLSHAIENSQARWRVLVEAAPVGIVEVDLEGSVLWWNRSAADLFRWPDQRNEPDSPHFPIAVGQLLRDTRLNPGINLVLEYELFGVQTGEETKDLAISLAPLISPDGSHRILTLATDVTDRHRLEADRRRAHRMDAVGQLAGVVAHDFNNLLTLIAGYADLLGQRLNNDDSSTLVNDIQTAIDRASALTGQLLTISQRRSALPSVVAPTATLESMLAVLERIMGVDVEVTYTLDPETGNVWIDPGQFEQVVLNLAINARDAMGGCGRLRVSVDATQLDHPNANELGLAPGRWVRIAVSDTGTGMNDEARERCFEPFFSTKGDWQGTGLGLPAVQSVVTESGGAIQFETELDVGTTFVIYLPAIDQEVPVDSEISDPLSMNSSETVLVVEDDPTVRHLVYQVLSQRGYRVLEAPSGTIALEIASDLEFPIDILVTDVVMPGPTGPELAANLWVDNPKLVVLFISGNISGISLPDSGLGSFSFLAKPFRPSQLLDEIRLLSSRSRTRELGLSH